MLGFSLKESIRSDSRFDSWINYQRTISKESLEKLLAYCPTHRPENYAEIFKAVFGASSSSGKTFGMPEYVYVYNPEGRSPSEILLTKIGSLAYDAIRCEGRDILVPYYYSAKEGIVEGCPKCKPSSSAAKSSSQPKGG